MTEPKQPDERDQTALRVQVSFGAQWLVLVPLFLGTCLMPLLLMFTSGKPWVTLAAIGALIATILAMVARSMALVTVGSDGVLVRRLGERRYLPFADIRDVAEIDGEKLRLSLRSGGFYDLYTHKDQNVGKLGYEEQCNRLLGRIRAEIGRDRDDERAQRAEVVIDRAREARQPGYRVAEPPSDDELWAVVHDAAASPEARARAAAALRRHAGGAPRERLLRIAADTAEPALAKAFRIAATEDEAEVEAAIAEVEAQSAGDSSARS